MDGGLQGGQDHILGEGMGQSEVRRLWGATEPQALGPLPAPAPEGNSASPASNRPWDVAGGPGQGSAGRRREVASVCPSHEASPEVSV